MNNIQDFFKNNSFALYAIGLIVLIAVLLSLQLTRQSVPNTSDTTIGGSDQSIETQVYIEEALENDGEVYINDINLTQEEFAELKEQLESEEEIEEVKATGRLLREWRFNIQNEPLDDR